MSYIYLGSPYSDPDEAKQYMRYRNAGRATAHLLRQGIHVYSPIVHCHHLAHDYGLPKDFEFWKEYNKAMLEKADMLMILKLNGWKESVGLDGEIAYATRQSIPIEFLDWPLV